MRAFSLRDGTLAVLPDAFERARSSTAPVRIVSTNEVHP